jgi:hypothetical protein
VDLDADPIELPFDGRAVEGGDRLTHALRGRCEHRKDRSVELEADIAKPFLAFDQRDLGGAREIPGEHQRPARDRSRDLGRLRNRVDHEAGERPLPQLAHEKPLHEPGLLVGGAAE